MKHMMTLLALTLALGGLGLSARAADAPKAANAQQSKMSSCNQQASGKTGDERKAFMKQCLSAKKPTQQDRMRTCNTQAQGKMGDERKAFMKECLSNKA